MEWKIIELNDKAIEELKKIGYPEYPGYYGDSRPLRQCVKCCKDDTAFAGVLGDTCLMCPTNLYNYSIQ